MEFKDLRVGDIILFKLNQELFHVAIFAPTIDRTSNIIDATSNKGVSRGTLEGIYQVFLACTKTGNLFGFFSNKLEIRIVRSKTLNGEEIAEQAEFWRLHGLTYDVNSLANIVERTEDPPVEPNEEAEEKNIRTYCNYATRRNTIMIDNPIAPNAIAVFCTFFLTPVWNFPKSFVNLFIWLIRYLQPVPDKGVNCAGFVLAVLGAVALQDSPLSDSDACREKLGKIAMIDPQNYNLIAVYHVFNDPQLFENKGVLNINILASEPFDKQVFHLEQEADSRAQRNLNFQRL